MLRVRVHVASIASTATTAAGSISAETKRALVGCRALVVLARCRFFPIDGPARVRLGAEVRKQRWDASAVADFL
jgi:hypothetical protein